MYLARPVYELLPYAYVIAGACALVGAWYARQSPWPTVLMIGGIIAIVGGLVIWLRRRDYRATQAQYTVKSLED
jgi:sugar phosphate permease